MTWVVSILVALISGVVGLLVAGFIANACVTWYQISSREGASGYFVIFFALVGGVASCIVGLIVARLIASSYGAGFVKELAAALGSVLLLAAFSMLLSRLFADVPPTIDGQELNLEVEFRFPNVHSSNQHPIVGDDWQFIFASIAGGMRRDYREGTIDKAAARFEAGQWIVPTRVELFTERGQRAVTLATRDATDVMGFLLPLPARPGRSYETWSEWLPRQQANGEPWSADKASYRFRIQKVSLPN